MKIGVSVICGLGESKDCDREKIQQDIIDMLMSGFANGKGEMSKIRTIEACISYAE